MTLTIGEGEHLFVCGQTGSGKSYRMERLIAARAQQSRVAIIDPKGEFWIKGAKIVEKYHKRHRVQIFRPDLDETAIPEVEQYDQFFRAIWRDGRPCTVYIDELNATLPGPQSCLRSLERMYRQGRSRRIVVWAATQRPKEIPSVAFTESTHILSFWLGWRGDAEKVESFTFKGVADQIVSLEWHHLLYCCPRRRQRLILPPNVGTDAAVTTPTPTDARPVWRRWLGL